MYGLGAEMMGPPVDPNQPVSAPDVQQQIADVWDYLWSSPQTSAVPVVVTGSWISGVSNSTVAIGGAALILLFALGRRR